jgi:2-succinyl-6-hydroxy-2,4-cyclohexadiene-1-carboxylate synthase
MSGLRYTASGSPRHPTILFLHGFMGSATDWAETMAALENHYRCLAVDLPGHGASVRLQYPVSYTMEGAARAVIDVLDEVGVQAAAAVVGYSMGGRLALYLALRHPERWRAVVLESASPGLEDDEERSRRRDADRERARRLENGDFEGFLRDWYRQPLFASLARDEALLNRTIEARLRNDPRELARSLRGMGTGSMPSLWDELSGLGVPALAVAGEGDEKFVGISRRMAAVSPLVRTVAVPRAGHNVHEESPEDYRRALEGFVLGK